MKQSNKKQWYQEPVLHVSIFFLLLALGAGIGIRAGSPLAGLTIGVITGLVAGVAASYIWEFRGSVPENQKSTKDIFDRLAVYTDGKMKRYSLLFGVNGGAFAIAQLIADPSKQLPSGLSLPGLGIGLILFTAVMTVDIWLWGCLMRREGLAGELAFSIYGKAILLLISGLIVSGWVLMALS